MELRNIKVQTKAENPVTPNNVIGSRASNPIRESKPKEVTSNSQESKILLNILDKVITLSIFLLFLGLPLFFTGLSLQGIVFEKQLYFYFLILLALVAWVTKGVIVGEMNIRRTPLDIIIIAFWACFMLATVLSVDRWRSFWGEFGDPSRSFMNVTAIVIAYYLVMSNFNKTLLRAAISGVVISGVIVSIVSLLLLLNIHFLPADIYQAIPISLVGSVSGLAAFLSFIIPILTVAIMKLAEEGTTKLKLKKIIQGVLLFTVAVDLFIILAVYNYVPWVGLFIGVSLMLIFILAKIVRPAASWLWLPMLVFVTVMVIRVTGDVSIIKANLPVEISPNYETSWDIAVQSLKDKFILGSGPATYSYNFALNRPSDFNLNTFYHVPFSQARGILFEALPTVGGLGTFVFVLLILSFLSLELYLLAKNKEKDKLYSLILFSSTIVLVVYAFTYRAEGTIIVLAALSGIIALATLMKESGSDEKYLNLSLKASPKFALALAFIFMVVSAGVAFLFVFLGKVYAADLYAGKSVRISMVNPEESIIKMGKAIRYNGREGKYFTQLSQYYMSMANLEAMKGPDGRDIQKIQQYLNYSISAAQQGKELLENDVLAVEALAQIYENAGLYIPDSLTLAEEAYKQGLELKPDYPNYYERLGQIKVSAAVTKKDEAEREALVREASEFFKKSIESKDNYAVGYYQLSLTQQALKEQDQAIENGTKAVQLDPKNTDYLLSLARIYQARSKDDDLKVAEQIYLIIISRNENNINGHFYLGLLYENMDKKQEAKKEYEKIMGILPENSEETKNQLQKMITNVEKGVKNTPETLGLVTDGKDVETVDGESSQAQGQEEEREGQE